MSTREVKLDLKRVLLERGISQAQMAFDLKIHPTTISRYLNGWHGLPPEEEQRVREYLGLCD